MLEKSITEIRYFPSQYFWEQQKLPQTAEKKTWKKLYGNTVSSSVFLLQQPEHPTWASETFLLVELALGERNLLREMEQRIVPLIDFADKTCHILLFLMAKQLMIATLCTSGCLSFHPRTIHFSNLNFKMSWNPISWNMYVYNYIYKNEYTIYYILNISCFSMINKNSIPLSY